MALTAMLALAPVVSAQSASPKAPVESPKAPAGEKQAGEPEPRDASNEPFVEPSPETPASAAPGAASEATHAGDAAGADEAPADPFWRETVAADDSPSGAHDGGAEPAVAAPGPDPMCAIPAELVYRLERIDVRGNHTRPDVITAFVPLQEGDTFDPNDPELGLARLSLIATGWFDDVRFSLERGSQRGAAVLVIEVEERNTLLVERLVAGLSRVVTNTDAERAPVRPYAGLGLRESNLLGLGIGLAGAGVISLAPSSGQVLQYGLDFRYHDPSLRGSPYDLRARVFHNHAREFFGRNPRVKAPPCPDPETPDMRGCDLDIAGRRAVVIYDRTGFGIGTGSHVTSQLRYSLGWLGERANVISKPSDASTQRGRYANDIEPIDFHIEDNVSHVSSLELGLSYDTRDNPTTPSTGHLLDLRARLAAGILASDYDFARVEAEYRRYFTLPWHHLLRLRAYAGSVFGYAPFFYHFYAADLSDLLPSRQLELNLDHRRTHDLLGTAIREMDQEELAARIDVEYQLPLLRGGKGIRRLDAFAGVGLFLLARRGDFQVAVPGYRGLSRVPVDLTFDIGVVADTDVGLFKVGFSSLIGFLPDLGQEDP